MQGIGLFDDAPQRLGDEPRARPERRQVGAATQVHILILARPATLVLRQKVIGFGHFFQPVIGSQQGMPLAHVVQRQGGVGPQSLRGLAVVERQHRIRSGLVGVALAIQQQRLGIQHGIGAALQHR